MDIFNSKCEIRKDNELKSKIVATADISPGEVILTESPLLVAPQWDSTIRCSSCFQDSIVMCDKCLFFPLCVKCGKHNQFDCQFFQNNGEISKNFLINHYPVFGPLKCLLLLENPETENQFQKILKLSSRQEERKSSGEWRKRQLDVVEPLMKSGLLELFRKAQIDADFLQNLCGIIDANSFEVRNLIGDVMKGVFNMASSLRHNCIPNTMLTFGQTFEVKAISSVKIAKDDEISFSFANPLMGTNIRRHMLKVQKHLACHCRRCEDPTELGTYMSSLKCKTCPEGYVTHTDTKWTCQTCAKPMERSDVHRTLMDANKDIITADGDIRNLEMLIMKFSRIFHPNHYLILDLKQNVASILRSICSNGIMRPGRKVFERKVQLCEDILPVLKMVQPGISRLTAIALYEYVVPLAELAAIEFGAKDISKEEYLIRLQKIVELAEDSLRMLSLEAPNSPEGHLSQQVRNEVNNLYLKINDIR